MKKNIRDFIRKINILNADREIAGNHILWSFIKLFSGIGHVGQAAAALTYHTLFAAVPVLALLVATARQMGYAELFREKVGELFFGADGVSDSLLAMTDSYLNSTDTTHWIGAVAGLVLLLYSVFSIYMTIDSSFNMLWNLKGHSIKKLIKHFILVLLVPFVLIMMLVMSITVSSYFGEGIFKDVNIFVLFVAMLISLLFVSYKFIPCTKVDSRYALISAVVCGSVLALLQHFSTLVFSAFTRMHDVYGGLAGIFLFLMWINISWYICLAGSRWIYLMQEGKRLDMENRFKGLSHNSRRSLLVMLIGKIEAVAKDRSDRVFSKSEMLSIMNDECNLPPSVTSHLIDEMLRKGMIVETSLEEEYTLCCELEGHTDKELADLVDNAGRDSLKG